jgi:hypothetical protein
MKMANFRTSLWFCHRVWLSMEVQALKCMFHGFGTFAHKHIKKAVRGEMVTSGLVVVCGFEGYC